MAKHHIPALIAAMLLPAALLLAWPTGAQNSAPPPAQPAPGGTRGPAALTFAPDGHTLYVAEQDENSVAVVDPDGRKAPAHIKSGGEQPVALALTADGRTLLTANTYSGSVGIIDLEKRTLRSSIPLAGMPAGVAVGADGRAFVSVSQLDEVAVIDTATAKVVSRIAVGRRPRVLVPTADRSTIFCMGADSGSLSLIDAVAMREQDRITLPAVNLRGIALSADGTQAYVTGQQPHNDLPTDRPEAMWSNVICVVRRSGSKLTLDRVIQLDSALRGAADPCGIALDPSAAIAYIALSGLHELLVQPLAEASTEPSRRIAVGANPRAVALRPGSAQLWIGNHLGSSLSVIEPRGVSARTVDLGPASPSPNRRLKGRFLFASARLARGQRFSCETCHPDGGTDGLSWKFSHVHDSLDVRNTRDLRGPLLLTGPYGWSGREQDFEQFVNTEIMGLFKTHRLAHADVHAFWDLINETPRPPNPYRSPDGALTPAALRGEALFTGKAACAGCHSGDNHGGVGGLAWIGTTPQGVKLDIPHLNGVYDTPPYLHDGSAATLAEIFSKRNAMQEHGAAHLLSPAEMSDLLEYVREL